MKYEDEVLSAVSALSQQMNTDHQDSKTTDYVMRTLTELKQLHGVAFATAFYKFQIGGGFVESAEKIELTTPEKDLWLKVRYIHPLFWNVFM